MWTEHPHTRLFLDTFILVHTSHCGSRSPTTCLHKTCSSTCLSVCCFLVLSSSSISRASTLSLSRLCPELQLPCCRERQALNPMRTRKMRSIEPWRYTTISQDHMMGLIYFLASVSLPLPIRFKFFATPSTRTSRTSCTPRAPYNIHQTPHYTQNTHTHTCPI